MNDHTPDSEQPWEGAMSSEFDRRVRDLHEAPLSLDTVKGKAMNIQRKRRLAVAGSVLAAAAVVVPVAVAAGHGLGDDRTTAPDVATSTPSPTAVDTATPTEPAAVAAMPSYLEGRRLHRTDGTVVRLPSAAYDSAASLGDRVVAEKRDGEGNTSIDVIEDGRVVDTYAGGATSFATSTAGTTVAFVTADGRVQTIWADGERVLADGYADWSVLAVTGGPDCEDPEAGGSGCRVFLRDNVDTRAARSIDAHGIDEEAVPGSQFVYDSDGSGRLINLSRLSDGEECSGIYDEESATQVSDQCVFRYQRFSPDGRHVLAIPAMTDGFGAAFVVAVDAATGEEVARFEDGKTGITRMSWVDDDTFAVQAYDPAAQAWSIQTVTIGDARPEAAVGPTPGADFDPPFSMVGS